MPVTSGPIISYVGEFKYGETELVRVATVPMVNYVGAVKELLQAKSGDKVPQLIRARVGYTIELRGYTPFPSYPGYCPVYVTLVGVDWRGEEYEALHVSLTPDSRQVGGSTDVTEHYRLPPLLLTPWRIIVDVYCQEAILDMDIELYVEWGW